MYVCKYYVFLLLLLLGGYSTKFLLDEVVNLFSLQHLLYIKIYLLYNKIYSIVIFHLFFHINVFDLIPITFVHRVYLIMFGAINWQECDIFLYPLPLLTYKILTMYQISSFYYTEVNILITGVAISH